MADLKLAVIGAGAMAREHIRAFQDMPGVAVAGIWNRTSDKARALAAEFGIAHVAADIAALKRATGADLAVIAVYETAIHAVALEAFAQDWAVLMEKPVGLDLADAEAIAAAAAGRRVFVGLNRRALGSTRAALADLADDPGPRFIHVQDQQSLETARVIGHAEPVIRNWMYANSIHLVDYLLAFGRGQVTEVQPLTRWDPANPGVVLAKVAFDSGDVGLYQGIWNGPGPWACTVSTPRRRWELRPLEKAQFQNAGERVLNPVDADPWDGAFKPGFRRQAEEVVAALAGRASAAVGLAEALRGMRLVRDIFQV